MFLWILALLLGLWILRFWFSKRRMCKLASLIPNSKEEIIPVIGLAHKFAGSMERSMDALKDLTYESMQHNGIIRAWLGPTLYFVLTNPADMQYVLKNCLEKDDLYRFLQALTGNGILFAPLNIWRTRRKFMTPAFSSKNLESSLEILSNQSKILAEELESKANMKAFSIWPQLTSYTFNTVCEVATGVKSDNFGKNFAVLEAFEKILELVSQRVLCLWLHPNWLFTVFPQYQEQKKCLAVTTNFFNKTIQKMRTEMSSDRREIYSDGTNNYRRPLLDVIITASGGKNGYSNVELREELSNITAAATDTSAISIGNVLKLLAKYPEVQDKVYKELYEIFGDSDRILVSEDLIQLQYLTHVIKETLRLFPPAPFIARKILEDITLPSGRVLPAGTGIICSIFGVHRDPKYWGPDAEHFDPDRFLPEKFKLTNACSFIPFSYGARNCIGYQYGMMSVKIALAEILRRFRVMEDRETGPIPFLKLKFNITMKVADGYQIALEKRKAPVKISKS